MPSFYLALLLIIAFSINLEWFPISGEGNKKIADVGVFRIPKRYGLPPLFADNRDSLNIGRLDGFVCQVADRDFKE